MEERHLCKNFDEWEGVCRLARPYCCDPFSEKSCQVFQTLVALINKEDVEKEVSHYVPSEQIGFTKKTWSDVVGHLGIKEGNTLARYYISDFELENAIGSKDLIFESCRREVVDELKAAGLICQALYTIRNYEMAGETGTLFLGVGENPW